MFRIITLKNGRSSRKYKVEFGDIDKARVTITSDKKVVISENIEERDETALFEAIFDGRASVNVVRARYDDDGMPMFTIGKLENSSDKIELKNAKIRKLKEIASERYNEEVSGVEVDGVFFRTDRQSVAVLLGEYAIAVNEKKYSTAWKTDDGFVTLTRDQVLNAAKCVHKFVQSCFDKEKKISEKINSASSIEAVEKISWR